MEDQPSIRDEERPPSLLPCRACTTAAQRHARIALRLLRPLARNSAVQSWSAFALRHPRIALQSLCLRKLRKVHPYGYFDSIVRKCGVRCGHRAAEPTKVTKLRRAERVRSAAPRITSRLLRQRNPAAPRPSAFAPRHWRPAHFAVATPTKLRRAERVQVRSTALASPHHSGGVTPTKPRRAEYAALLPGRIWSRPLRPHTPTNNIPSPRSQPVQPLSRRRGSVYYYFYYYKMKITT